ncbi:hypothetical protein M406DRAFT_244575 [Cryphonectria parasitica EP155]|uniref:UBZ4-type domain-containing protein n=1 Tax=Cryphonectria parasitica (strain ATCC 38755 / EP155) TaxID=660469 RepID=A0A9P4YAH2_CRYP1|nr:uncharacterized protein M406DRAFT_244575 [Cryphonectria parasitica EP155]KAF3769783.1 hypothetical protein M406DRAFT_244575 [Cryphonectria parasitica EP155]
MNNRRPRHPPVPKTTAVRPGAAVNIVLKADQPTGRTVSGIVRDVLTRGDHPRGIKVRLADGRVGRVQSMASAGSSSGPSGGETVEGFNASGSRGGMSERRGRRRRQGGFEEGGEDESLPTQQVGLDAYVKQAKPKRRKGKGVSQMTASDEEEGQDASPPSALETVTCPVCGAFEGDAAAVSHHVATHFDSAD